MFKNNFFSGTVGIAITGAVIGICVIVLQYLGNPPNMGFCAYCFERDMAGAIGLHRASIVQYLRPEIMGLVFGAFVASFIFKDFKSKGGSSPAIRFALGFMAALCALVFLGCPWRAVIRLAGGDLNALVGFAGLAVGVYIGGLFFKKGFDLGRNTNQRTFSAYLMPLFMLGLLALYFAFPQKEGEPANSIIFYSISGPGSMHAPALISLGIAFVIGFIAQRSRFCTVGGLRDIFLFKYFHLFIGLVAFFIAMVLGNMFVGAFHLGFENQPVAHTDGIWNFLSMLVVGFALVLSGGCPARQLVASAEGNNDATVFVFGAFVGTAMAHNFQVAASGAGIGNYSIPAVLISLALCFAIGFTYIRKG